MIDLCFILATERYRDFGLALAGVLQEIDVLLHISCAHSVSWVCSGYEIS